MSRYNNKPLEVKNGKVTEIVNSSPDLVGLLEKVISKLQKEFTHYPKYTNLKLESVPQDYEDGYHTVLMGTREATDEEKKAWEDHQAGEDKQRKEWDLQQLEYLKKKYGTQK